MTSLGVEPRLRCAECGRLADERALGWRALHGREQPEDEPDVFVFCPACAEREFGAGPRR